jgi:hypothetical protein
MCCVLLLVMIETSDRYGWWYNWICTCPSRSNLWQSTRAGEGSLAASTSFQGSALPAHNQAHINISAVGRITGVMCDFAEVPYGMILLADRHGRQDTSQDAEPARPSSSRNSIPGNSRTDSQEMTFGDRRRAPGSVRLTMRGLAEVPYSRDIPALSLSIKQVEGDNNDEGYHLREITHTRLTRRHLASILTQP